MGSNSNEKTTREYCPRFGEIAVELGFITEAQLEDALASQSQEKLSGKEHRLMGTILFENGWMSGPQVDQVLTELFRRRRGEEN
ncbi:MAG: hypothetical protein P8Y63_06400 [Deltaproteobacteria bacterium]|jgi:hypothetical protein